MGTINLKIPLTYFEIKSPISKLNLFSIQQVTVKDFESYERSLVENKSVDVVERDEDLQNRNLDGDEGTLTYRTICRFVLLPLISHVVETYQAAEVTLRCDLWNAYLIYVLGSLERINRDNTFANKLYG